MISELLLACIQNTPSTTNNNLYLFLFEKILGSFSNDKTLRGNLIPG